MSWHIPLQLGDGGAELMGCALSPDGIYVDAPVRMGEVCIEKALYVEGIQFESHEEGDMGGVEIESHEEGDMGGGQMLSTEEGDMGGVEIEYKEVERESNEEEEGGSPISYGAMEEEGEVNVLAEEWLPTIGDGNEVFTTCTHHISTAHQLISSQMTTPFLLHMNPHNFTSCLPQVRQTTLPPLSLEVGGAPSVGVNNGAFASQSFNKGAVVAWYDGDVVLDAKSLEVQTHALTVAGVGIDGLKVPVHGRGAGSFINDTFHVLGQARPGGGGGQFLYNVKCVRRANGRYVFLATTNISSGEEFFYKYENLEVAMGWVRYRSIPRPTNTYARHVEYTGVPQGLCPGCNKWGLTSELVELPQRYWHEACLPRVSFSHAALL